MLTLGGAGIVLFVGAAPIAGLFTSDSVTLGYAVAFTRVFGISMVFFGVFFPFAGSLRGAGDTRTLLYARFTGTFGFMLVFSYVVGVVLGYSLFGIYIGIVLSYAWWALVAAAGFVGDDWANTAARMMTERETIRWFVGRPRRSYRPGARSDDPFRRLWRQTRKNVTPTVV